MHHAIRVRDNVKVSHSLPTVLTTQARSRHPRIRNVAKKRVFLRNWVFTSLERALRFYSHRDASAHGF